MILKKKDLDRCFRRMRRAMKIKNRKIRKSIKIPMQKVVTRKITHRT